MKKKSKKYLPILRTSAMIPWGYVQSEEDESLLLPRQEALEYLEHAKKELLPHYSYAKVSEWLTKVSGLYISPSGLRTRCKIEPDNASKEKYFKNLEKKLDEARRQAEKYGNRIGGTNSYIWQ